MCGIAGIIPLNTSRTDHSAGEKMLQNALAAMHHRGPDACRIVQAGRNLLGHNRLSILDLSEKAAQPMTDASGRYIITFNGEIFNYKDLRHELNKKGITFNSDSDTEVLLQMLILEGEKCLNKLNGFFAFVFVDTHTNSGILVRDRFGEKPLWYHQDENSLVFASELKGLRALGIPSEIDPTSLALLLQFSYIPAPHSIFKGVSKMMPGELIRFENHQITTKTWYQIHDSDQIKDLREASSQLHNLLDDAVKLRLHADVPVGCFLSGGVDSSIVAYLAKKHKSDLQTFSIGFSDVPYLDESHYSTEVAAHLGTTHHVIDVTSQMMIEEAAKIWDILDEPFADSSAIAGYILAKHTRRQVTVSLSGDGADELFGGYNKHAALARSMQTSISHSLIKMSLPLLKYFPKGRTGKISNLTRKLSRYAEGLDLSLKDRYELWASFSDPKLSGGLVKNYNELDKKGRLNQYLSVIRDNDMNSLLVADQKLVLPNDMLTKVDITSMACSLEVRPPFMDFRVVEFANRLSADFKINEGKRKVILKEAFGKMLPESVFNRWKQGFEVPLEQWLLTWMKPLVLKHLSASEAGAFQYLERGEVRKVLDSFYNKKQSGHASLIYSMLTFAMWLEQQKISLPASLPEH